MSTPEQYRFYARESVAAAAKAKVEAQRQALLDMARTWELAALQLESCAPVKNSSSIPLCKSANIPYSANH